MESASFTNQSVALAQVKKKYSTKELFKLFRIYFWLFIKQSKAKLSNEPFRVAQTELTDFYQTNPIARASSIMAKCIKEFENRQADAKKQQAL